MAVTLISSPDPFALTKGGRMQFRFQGSGRLSTTGVQAVNAIKFSGAVPSGTIIKTRWNGKDYPIVAKTIPSAANEFPAGDGSATYVDSLVQFFESYFPFREDFTVSRLDFISHQIILTAKTAGAVYNLSAPSATSTVEVVTATAGADPIVRDDYSVYAELWIKRPNQDSFTRKQSFIIATQPDGTAQLDVGAVLHAEMLPDWPNWSFNQPTGSTQSHLQYYIAYGESFGQPQQIGQIQTDTARDAYFGGVNYLKRAGSGFPLSGFIATTSNSGNDKALRLGALTRYVREDEPQFLTFLNTRADVSAIELEIVLVQSDGSEKTVTDQYAPTDWPKGAKLTYAVGIQQLQLATKLDEGKTLTEYKVRLISEEQYFSTQYRYILAGNYEPFVRYFAYLNSFGCVDTLTTFGKGSYELTRFYEQADRYLPAGYDAQLGQIAQYDVALQQQIEVTTGWRSQTELKLWDDFYRSPYLFLMRQTQALPIGIVSKSIKQGKDLDNQYAHSFEFQYLWKDDFYSDEADPELLGDPLPPVGGGPVAPIVITQPTVVESVDHTVPDVVRAIDQTTVNKWNTAFSWGNHALQGYLTQASAASLFYRQDQKIDFINDVIGKPNSRDGYGISDVLTTTESATQATQKAFLSIKNLVGFRPVARSWTGDVEPE